MSEDYKMYGNFKALKDTPTFVIGGTEVQFEIHYFCNGLVYANSINPTHFGRTRKDYYSYFTFVFRNDSDLRFTIPHYYYAAANVYFEDGQLHRFYRSDLVPPYNPMDYGNGRTSSRYETTSLRPVQFPEYEQSINFTRSAVITDTKIDTLNSYSVHSLTTANLASDNFTDIYIRDFVSEVIAWRAANIAKIMTQEVYWLDREAERILLNENENNRRALDRATERQSVETLRDTLRKKFNVL